MRKRRIFTASLFVACMSAVQIQALTDKELLDDLMEPSSDTQKPATSTMARTEPTGDAQALPKGASDKGDAKAVAPVGSITSGRIAETVDAGGYTYLLLEKEGVKKWVAIPAAKVSVGQEVQVAPGLEMGLFTSKSLGRSFQDILFSPGLVVDKEAKKESSPAQVEKPAGMTAHKGMTAMSAGGKQGDETAHLSGTVIETMNSGGYTYVCLEKGGTKTWAAVPTMQVVVGDSLELQPGTVMTNFTSKSLDRTFERVVFSGGPVKK